MASMRSRTRSRPSRSCSRAKRDRLVEGGAPHPDGVRGDQGAAGVEGLHRRLESGAALVALFAAQQVGRRDADVVEGERRRLVGLEAHLPLDVEAAEPRRVAFDEEGALCATSLATDRGSPARGSSPRDSRADEALGAVQDPAVAVLAREGADRGGVGARAGLGHGEAGPARGVGLEEGAEEALLLLVGPHREHVGLGQARARASR